MLPDRVSNPGPLTYESGALPIALRGLASLPIRSHSCQPRLNASPFFFDGWIDDAILCPFNSISIIAE